MGWLRLDDGYDENPKIAAVGKDAAWLNVRALLLCARRETDGHVPQALFSRISSDFPRARARKLADALVAVHLWEVDPNGDGWWIHDYLDYNPSAADLRDRRYKRVTAGRKGGRRSGEARSAGQANGSSNHEANTSASLKPPSPTPPLAGIDKSSPPPFPGEGKGGGETIVANVWRALAEEVDKRDLNPALAELERRITADECPTSPVAWTRSLALKALHTRVAAERAAEPNIIELSTGERMIAHADGRQEMS